MTPQPPAAPTVATSTAANNASSSSSSSSPPVQGTSVPAAKKRKVGQACVYCRRSHMTCDSQRPCKRCIKRDIGHLCHDETPGKGHGHAHHAMPKKQPKAGSEAESAKKSSEERSGGSNGDVPRPQARGSSVVSASAPISTTTTTAPLAVSPPPSVTPTTASGLGGAGFLGLGGSDAMHFAGGMGGGGGGRSDAAGGHEYNLLSEFLESLDGGPVSGGGAMDAVGAAFGLTPAAQQQQQQQAQDDAPWANSGTTSSEPPPPTSSSLPPPDSSTLHLGTSTSTEDNSATQTPRKRASRASSPLSLSGFSTKKEKFFLTAADQVDGPRDERLSKVIQAKYDAGLLRPYNHVKGYARLNSWMEKNVSQASRRRILKPLSVFRPRFRAVASSLSDIDLIYIEEAFERLLLDYDRVFSTQGIPACLWRRTGEVYKGNREFAELVGVGLEELREGRVAIYEFMQEESACNYWEKYGAVSFDPGQKAVLTSCVLQTAKQQQQQVNCCFSFTIRRDSFGCPTAIVGNFLPIGGGGGGSGSADAS